MFVIDAEQREAMRESFARLLADRCSEADVRRIMGTQDAHDPALWAAMAEMGLLATLIPEEHGGLSGGPLEIELLMEEAGRALLPGPFLSSAVLATALLAASRDDAVKARLFPQLANGTLIGTAALAGEAGLWDGNDSAVTAAGSGEDVTLSGTADYVGDAAIAGLLLVVAGKGNARRLYEVTARDRVSVTTHRGFDLTQRIARVDFAETPAREIAGGDATAIDRALDLVRVAKAGREAGAAARNFEFTVEYLRTRIQFGRQIGGFQAMKHIAADLLIESESAVTGARAAAEALAGGAADAAETVAMASFAVNEAQGAIAFNSINMHGGIGFTWQHPAHLYLRRARFDQMFLGSNDLARDRFVALLENAA